MLINLKNVFAVHTFERLPLGSQIPANNNPTSTNMRAVAYYMRDIPKNIPSTRNVDFELHLDDPISSFALFKAIEKRKESWSAFDDASDDYLKKQLWVNFDNATYVMSESDYYCQFGVSEKPNEFEFPPVATLIRPYEEIKSILQSKNRAGLETPKVEGGNLLQLQ